MQTDTTDQKYSMKEVNGKSKDVVKTGEDLEIGYLPEKTKDVEKGKDDPQEETESDPWELPEFTIESTPWRGMPFTI